MNVTDYVQQQLAELLEERRVVVWYDAERAFHGWVSTFKAANCIVVDSSASVLEARRRADEIFVGLNDPDEAELRHKKILIYCPRSRAKREEEMTQDPFEVFAVVGAAFGDKEGEGLQSLARQAMPEHSAEIDRLFAEARRPALSVLENLKMGASYPLLRDCLGSDAAVDVAAAVLCVRGQLARIGDAPGASDELLRLLRAEFGYSSPSAGALDSRIEPFSAFVLLSELAFDLDTPLPDALASMPRASVEHKTAIFALCDRMRRSDDFRDGYVAQAQQLESTLRLRELFAGCDCLGERDTFPFEERHYLREAPRLVTADKLLDAAAVIAARRDSVWSSLGDRAVLWKAAQRSVDLLSELVQAQSRLVNGARPVKEHLAAYVDRDSGLWRVDQLQRLVEQSAADCAEHDDIEPLFDICRRRYLEFATQAQDGFQQAVERDGWPPDGPLRQTQVFGRHVAPALQEGWRVAYFLVDSMRFEMGCHLAAVLADMGQASVEPATSVLPTVTPFAMAALLPGADAAWKIVERGGELVPAIGDELLPGVTQRIALLKARFGDRYADATLEQVLSLKEKRPPKQIAGAELLVVRTQEMDSYGEVMSLYQARKHMTGILGELVTAVQRLSKLGFTAFVFVSDHGHILLPEIAAGDAIRKPPGEWMLEKRRCLLGHSTGPAAGVLILKTEKLGIPAPVLEMAVAKGFCVFTAGASYFHEGISLPECIVPVVTLRIASPVAAGHETPVVSIRYRSDSFTSRVIGLKLFYTSLFDEALMIRLEAYDGSTAKSRLVGQAADCDDRDPSTGLVTLRRGKDIQVPLRLDDDFEGEIVEIRAIDAAGPGMVLARIQLKNNMLI